MSETLCASTGATWANSLFLVIGTIGMAFTLMTISILISFRGTDKEGPTSQASIAFFVIVGSPCRLVICFSALTTSFQYMLFFGASLNAIPWCYAPEILPLKARAKGTSLAVNGQLDSGK